SVDTRHVAPPKTSQWMTEIAGKLDASMGTGTNFTQTYRIAQKEKGSFRDAETLNAQTGVAEPIPDSTDVDPVTLVSTTIKSVEFITTGGSSGYAVHHEEQLSLPYLPDPFAHGAALRGLPGQA